MNTKFKSITAILLVLLLSAALVGCGNNDIPETPWEWAQSIDESDVNEVSLWCSPEYYELLAAEDGSAATAAEGENPSYQQTSAALSEKQVSKLAKNLYRLEETNFGQNAEANNETPLYGLIITMQDGTFYNINKSNLASSEFEMSYGENEWIINSEKFNSYVDSLLSDCGFDEAAAGYASSSDLIIEEVTGSDLEGGEDYSYSTYGNLG